jgi:cystathionine beta-lyase/cystathionine gamma-synthase
MSTPPREHGPSTRGIHAGRRPQAGDSAVVTPIYQTATFVPSARDHALVREGREYESSFYSRYGNPTVVAVERRIADLEGAEQTRLFASGNAAMHATLMALALPGGHVLAADRLYGGTRGILDHCLVPAGGAVTYVDLDDDEALRAAFRPATRVLLCESIANPTLEVADIARLAQLAHAQAARLVVDATYASPILQRPLERGADVSLHSASKYLGGHSDLVAGAVSADPGIMRKITAWRVHAGGCLDPHSAFLVDRGIKTLALRMVAHAAGAQALAEFLVQHPAVSHVRYPGLASFPHHARARENLEGFGGMVLATLKGDDAAASRVLERLRIALAAPSLGGVETLVSQPALTSHASLDEAQRLAIGIPPGTMRISVGIEDPADLIADFAQALA